MNRWRALATASTLVASALAAGAGSSAGAPAESLRLLSGNPSGYHQPATFTISGATVQGMYPSAVRPMPLTIVNPYPFDLVIGELRGRVVSTSNRRCRPANLVVRPYAGGLPLTAPARRRTAAGVLRLHMPPGADQACAGASFHILLTGTAKRAGR